MDFYYEQEGPQDVPSDNEGVTKDEKTNEVFDTFENNFNKVYDRTTKGLQTIIKDDKDGVKLDIPLDEATSEKAQAVLTALDNNLAKAEGVAASYWQTVNKPSFWSNITDNLGSRLDQVVQLTNETIAAVSDQGVQDKTKPAIAGNRTDAELKELSTDKSIYLNAKDDKSLSNADIDLKTDEISKILEENKSLENLMNEIVPQQVSYTAFWTIFLTKRDEILKREEMRKKILVSKDKDTEEQEVGWDDEEETTDANENGQDNKTQGTETESTREESPVVVSRSDARPNSQGTKADVAKSNSESAAKKEDDKAAAVTTSTKANDVEEEEDDDDDEWE